MIDYRLSLVQFKWDHYRSRKVHAKLNVSDDGLRKQELAKEIATSVMLVAVVLAFLLCNTLVSLHLFSNLFHIF